MQLMGVARLNPSYALAFWSGGYLITSLSKDLDGA
jgi:hypothetical protein